MATITSKSNVSGNAPVNARVGLTFAQLWVKHLIRRSDMSDTGHRRPHLSDMKRFISAGFFAAALTFTLWHGPALAQQAQSETPPSSKGENFSAKPPAQLFASDCTGAGCHKGPQGLAKSLLPGSLASFLREHYTNSRESAAALASYLSKLPSGPEPKDKDARNPRTTRPASATPGWGFGLPSGEPGAVTRPDQKDTRTPRQAPATRTSRTPARPDEAAPEKPTAAAPTTPVTPDAQAGEGAPKPSSSTRAAQRRQPDAAPDPAEAAPTATAPPAAAPATPPAAAPQFDIFD
jgi:hypothetical protein